MLMLKELLGNAWRHVPRFARRFLSRLAQPRFTVSASAVVIDPQGRVLLLKHVFRPGSGWGLPGGFLKTGEQPEAALKRELREEVGLELQQVRQLRTRSFRKPRHVEVVFTSLAEGQPQPNSLEIAQAGWFTIEDLPPGLSDDHCRLIEVALRNREEGVD
jgi:8-oxo-dGTP diphosphatase